MGILAAIGKIGRKGMPRTSAHCSGRATSAVADVVISGYFGYGNSGDDTVLDCLVAALRDEYPDRRIAVLCRRPKEFGEAHGVIGIGRYDLPAIISVLFEAKLLISGGGSLLQNETSSRSLFYYAGVIRLANFLGTRVVFCANGIGPLKGRIAMAVARSAAMSAERISVRDPLSKTALEKIGVPADRVIVTADPAFRLSRAERETAASVKGRCFAVSVRETDKTAARELCRACRDIYLNLGLVPVFVEMQEGEDGNVCRLMAEECCGEAVVLPHLSAAELCKVLADVEFVLTMRLHMMIYAASVGTSSVGVSDDPKFDGIAKILGGTPVIHGGFRAEDIIAAARHALAADRDEILRIAGTQATAAREDILAVCEMIKDRRF